MEQAQYELMAAVEERMWWFRGLHALILATYARVRRGSCGAAGLPALDAGCGTGGLLKKLVSAAPDAALVGLDYAPMAASVTRAKATRPVVVGTVNDLPFRDRSLAAVFSMDVLCHSGVDDAKALAEAHRCLAPGGVMIVNLPAYRWMFSKHDELVNNARRYTRSEIVALLRGAGFTTVWTTYWNTLLFPIMVLKRKVIGGEFGDVRRFPIVLEYLFRFTLAIERALIGLGLRFPFGGSIFAVAVKA
jgi:ubiquinone/menaquinone biosynthesis C-methylase UbiE